jgi:hypothetical protein
VRSIRALFAFAFRRSDLFRGKIYASVLAVLALAFTGIFLYGIFIGARHVLPASHGAPQVGQTVPDSRCRIRRTTR